MKTSPRLSDDDLVRVLELAGGSDSVELKLTIPAEITGLRSSLSEWTRSSAQIRLVSFFDTPDLTLNKAGLVVRARRVRGVRTTPSSSCGRWSPTTSPSTFASRRTWSSNRRDARRLRLLGVDEGAARHGRRPPLHLGERPRRKLFTKEQRAFYDQHAPEGLAIEDLALLGPIFVLKLKFKPEGAAKRKMVAEMWLYPDGARILELSTKCAPDQMFQVANEVRGYLASKGIDVGGQQTTKTATALGYFAKHLSS